MAEEKKIEAEGKPEAEGRNRNIKPAWLPWLVIGAELVIVLGIGALICLAALA